MPGINNRHQIPRIEATHPNLPGSARLSVNDGTACDPSVLKPIDVMNESNKGYVTQQLEWSRRVVSHALEDRSFRDQLIDSPREALESRYGTKVPEEIEIQVLQQDGRVLYIVLPDTSHERIEELDADALDRVAGGWEPSVQGWIDVHMT